MSPEPVFNLDDLRRRILAIEEAHATDPGAPAGPAGMTAELRQALDALIAAEATIRQENAALAAARDRSEAALVASEARLRAILASTLDPVVTIDAVGTIQSASNSIERVLGWRPSDLIGRNIAMLMPEPHRSGHDDYLDRYRRTGETSILGRTREFEALHASGRRVPIDLSVARVDLPRSEGPLFTGILRDITERRENDDQLRLIQSLTLAIGAAKDLEGAMVVTLERICGATGCPYGEAWVPDDEGVMLLDTPIWHAARADLDVFQRMTQGSRFAKGEGLPGRAWASMQPEWLSDLTDETLFRRAAAASHAGLRAAVAVPILLEDEVVAVVAFFMTEAGARPQRLIDLIAAAAAPLGPLIQRKRVEVALAESERRLREMLRTVELVAVTLNRAGGVTFCNDHLLAVTGWSRGEVLGRNWFEQFVPAEESDAVRAVFREAVDHGTIRAQYENEILTRTGERRLVAWNNSLLRDPQGTVIGTTSLGVDISDQRRDEQELARYREHLEQLVDERTRELKASHEQLRVTDRLASIGTLVAGLGHDMNNVLLPLRSRLEVLEALELPAGAKEHFGAVRHSVDYLQQLTDGLHLLALDPEDPEASSVETTNLAAWWHRAGPLIMRVAPSSAAFEGDFPDDLPPVGVAPHRLSQAILNLVVNASEVLPAEGRITITARSVRESGGAGSGAGGEAIIIAVRDNGIGMTPEVRRRALDPFFTTKKRGLGTGLGLSLVHGVAKSAGGSVEIESTPGAGTEVRMMLPARRPVSGAEEDATPSRYGVITIGDKRIASLVATLLQTAGITPRHADTADRATDALWIVEAERVDIERARAFLETPRRSIVACGPANGEWSTLGTLRVEEIDDFMELRNQIREAARRIGVTKS